LAIVTPTGRVAIYGFADGAHRKYSETAALIEGIQGFQAGRISQPELNALYRVCRRETIQRLEATGSPSLRMENSQHSWPPIHYGLEKRCAGWVRFWFADGTFELSRLDGGPFRYKDPAMFTGNKPSGMRMSGQASGHSASALSLLYPQGSIRAIHENSI